jgi:hypothetical protein
LSVACQEKSKVSPEEMEAEVVTFEECLEKIEAMGLEANPEVMEAVLEQQELCISFVVWHH